MFLLLGPTASGKSELAVEAASRCDAEIVGADAFQVYRGLDLLTAKPDASLLGKVPHHLIGEIPLGEKFDVAQYLALARERIRGIRRRGRRALVAGGTGLYVRALTHGLSDLPDASPELRRELESSSLAELQRQYAALDPAGFERIDRANPRRLIRAIEVSLLAGAPFSSLRDDWSGRLSAPDPCAGILLERDPGELRARIDERVRLMFARGVVEEVRAAGEAGPTASQAIGYPDIRSLLRGEITEADCIAAIQLKTRQYAKRQLTWLRRDHRFERINLTGKPQNEVAELIARRIMDTSLDAGAGEPNR